MELYPGGLVRAAAWVRAKAWAAEAESGLVAESCGAPSQRAAPASGLGSAMHLWAEGCVVPAQECSRHGEVGRPSAPAYLGGCAESGLVHVPARPPKVDPRPVLGSGCLQRGRGSAEMGSGRLVFLRVWGALACHHLLAPSTWSPRSPVPVTVTSGPGPEYRTSRASSWGPAALRGGSSNLRAGAGSQVTAVWGRGTMGV